MPLSLKEILQCGACGLQYDVGSSRPKLLQCHHSFCEKCIQNFIQSDNNANAVKCPSCSTVTPVDINGIPSLPPQDYSYFLQFNLVVEEEKYKDGVVPERSAVVKEKIENKNHILCDSENGVVVSQAKATFIKTSSSDEAQTRENPSTDGPVFCQTGLSMVTPACLDAHQYCSYDRGVRELQVRLQKAVQQAGQQLVQEASLLEEYSNVQNCWSSVGQALDKFVLSQNLSLSSARSLLEKLSHTTVGLQSDKIGDPSTLSRAVTETEILVANSVARINQTRIKSKLWKTFSGCKISIESQKLNTNPLTIGLDKNKHKEEDMVCLGYALSRLIERGDDVMPTNITETSSRSITLPVIMDKKNQLKPPQPITPYKGTDKKNSKPDEGSTNFVQVRPSYKIPKLVSLGYSYCFFDVGQGSLELGRVIMEIDCKSAPIIAKNFIGLCEGKHGFGYKNTTIYKPSTGRYVSGGNLLEGGHCSIYNKRPFVGDASFLEDSLGALRMRGRGILQDGQPIVGARFMIWVEQPESNKHSRSLVFGRVTQGLEIFRDMLVSSKLLSRVFIIKCGVLE